MNLDTVINETKDGKTYVLIYPIKTINGNVTYKKFKYYLYEGLKDYIVFTRVDITDLILLERNHVTSACLKEKALIDMRKLLIDNPKINFIYYGLILMTSVTITICSLEKKAINYLSNFIINFFRYIKQNMSLVKLTRIILSC